MVEISVVMTRASAAGTLKWQVYAAIFRHAAHLTPVL
jgi:hypothetical protein